MPPSIEPRRRWLVLAAVLFAIEAAAEVGAASGLSGRWQGQAQLPGTPMPIVLDLAPATGSAWVGSLILPGRGVKGAPLAALKVDGAGLEASLASAFGGPASLNLKQRPDGGLAGTLGQGGHQAEVVLWRTGEPQVDLPRRGTSIDVRLVGTWTGRYELAGAPRDVTLTLVRLDGDAAGGELKIVGKRTTQLAIDRVFQSASFIELEAGDAGIHIEGRWRGDDGMIDGTFSQGPFEAPLQLRRQAVGARQ
jgi:hypothetical protein